MLGGIAVVLFAVLFFRLWVLQVLSAERYVTAAAASQARTVRVQAPRGRILDVNGNVLVGNRPGDAITFDLTTDEQRRRRPARSQPPKQAPPPPPPTTAQMKKLLKGLKGKKRARKRARILALSEPKPLPKVWRGCARHERHAGDAGGALRDAARDVRGPHPRRDRPHAVRAGHADRRRRAAADLLREGERRPVPGRPDREAHAARLPRVRRVPAGRLRGADLRHHRRGHEGRPRRHRDLPGRRGGRRGRPLRGSSAPTIAGCAAATAR